MTTIVVGLPTLRRLLNGETVELSYATLIPDSTIMSSYKQEMSMDNHKP